MPISTVALLAAAADLLNNAGYRTVSGPVAANFQARHSKLFEDPFSLVGIFVYETWEELSAGWPDAQALIVETMALRLAKSDPKSWDGYLVLLTPGFPSARDGGDVNAIRYDTTRVRKLVGTGDDLKVVDDVKHTVLPLLSVEPIFLERRRDIFDLLVDALVARGLDRQEVTRLIQAFDHNQPMISAVHRGQDAT